MDDSFVLQTLGRLYLELARLQALLGELPKKDAEIAELRRYVEQLQREPPTEA